MQNEDTISQLSRPSKVKIICTIYCKPAHSVHLSSNVRSFPSLMMILKFAIILAFGLIGAVAGPYEEAEGIRTLNFTRPVEVCADSNPQRMYYSGEQSFNFTEFYFANKFHKSAEYGLSLTWAKDYMFGDALVSSMSVPGILSYSSRYCQRFLAKEIEISMP